jgi:hypothetical protein
LFICLLGLLNNIIGQQCNNDYVISNNNNEQVFTISSTNNSCICKSFGGDGSKLTNLNNNTIISSLITQINNNLEIIGNMQNQITLLNQTVYFVARKILFGTLSASTPTALIFNQIIVDSHSKYSNVTGAYKIPIDGLYHL